MANGIFNPGTGTLKSTTLVGAFIELAMLIQTQERIALGSAAVLTANNVPVPDNINITANFNTDTLTVAIPSLPINVDLAGGVVEITAIDYLATVQTILESSINSTLDVTTSDLVSTSKIGALLELAQLIQVDELAENQNQLTVTYNTDNKTASISGTFSGLPQVNATGRIEFVPLNYLA